MRKVWLFLLVLFLHPLFLGGESATHKKLPEAELRPILEGIKPYAITFGEGRKEVHVFIDPMCTLSKEYMKWVTTNERLRKRYTYYIYMYKLKKYDSMDLMRYIYGQTYRFNILKQVMVENLLPDTAGPAHDPAIEMRIEAIAEAARRIDVYKRPYFIILRREQ